jgi:hypothetical protein
MWESLTKALRAAVIVVGHALIAAALVVSASGVEHLIRYLNEGHDLLIYGQLPMSYLFQTIDIAMIGVFGVFGVIEAVKIMRE